MSQALVPAATKRLQFRELTPDDAEVMFLLHSNPDVMQYIGMPPWHSFDEGIDYIYKNLKSYSNHGFGRWVIERRSDGAWLGLAGLLVDQHQGFVDLGYRLFPEYWGQGYATEAALAVLNFGFVERDVTTIVALVDKGNLASEKVLRKLGMRYTMDSVCMGLQVKRFEMNQVDFKSSIQ